MRHYFVNREHDESEYFFFEEDFNNVKFKFKSCNDVFSKNELDYGSLVLIKTILKYSEDYKGSILDMCCGYGTIAILLSKFLDAKFTMCDINQTAVDLAKFNAELNGSNVEDVFQSDMFERVVKSYNCIVSNPPIKTGKKTLFSFIDGAKNHLEELGTVTLVIKKNLGADSLKKYMMEVFGNCDILARDKGYYILRSTK